MVKGGGIGGREEEKRGGARGGSEELSLGEVEADAVCGAEGSKALEVESDINEGEDGGGVV
jgi:hypothetical protein